MAHSITFDLDFSDPGSLLPRFEAHWRSSGLPDAPGLRDEIARAHLGPERHYHSLAHIVTLLDWIATRQLELPQHQRLVWTALFHDIVYDSRRTDNEAASAEIALHRLGELDWPEADRAWIADTIRRTAGHFGQDADPLARLFLDLDLLILAAPADIYDAYAAAVRQEYSWVTPEQYQAGRQRVLQHFLHAPFLYFSPDIKAQYTPLAHENLNRELEKLNNEIF